MIMMNSKNKPQVGLGVILLNSQGKILVGKRKGSLAPYYSIPGGKLDLGETFAAGAIREIKEETNLDLQHPQVIAITNNLKTYQEEALHFISIILFTTDFTGTLKLQEPEKCTEWLWVDPRKLPQPHFDASTQAVTCYLEKKFYKEFN